MPHILTPARRVRAGAKLIVSASLRGDAERGSYLVEFCGSKTGLWSPLIMPSRESLAAADRAGWIVAAPECGVCHAGEPRVTRQLTAPSTGYYRVIQEVGPGALRSSRQPTLAATMRTENAFAKTFGWIMAHGQRLCDRRHAPRLGQGC